MGKNYKYPIIFTHVPRTGGLTLTSILSKNFKANERELFYVTEQYGNINDKINRFNNLDKEVKSKLRLISGHFNFGLHKFYEDFSYITLFRDPIDRAISYYFYIYYNKNHYLHQTIRDNNYNIIDIYKNGISIEFDNIQVRQMSNCMGTKFGKCDETILDKARENLRDYYKSFCLLERYNESLLLLKKELGLKTVYYKKINVNKKRVYFKNDFSNKIIRSLEEYNKFDIILYEDAKRIFEEKIKNANNDFFYELNKFNRRNKILQFLTF